MSNGRVVFGKSVGDKRSGMRIGDLIWMALRNLLTRRYRTVFNMLGIVVG